MINQNSIKSVLRAGTPEDIAKKVNLALKESGVFASPIHQDNITNQWIAFIYSRDNIQPVNSGAIPFSKEENSNFSNKPSTATTSPSFNSSKPVSDKQIAVIQLLRGKLKIKEPFNTNITSKEASKIIDELNLRLDNNYKEVQNGNRKYRS